ncbi:MAG: Nramp family divalent metal transporter [Candidatus Cloacimonetes bacterium]|nr:Nramp family divalent metal transporter [Candidatus Cloacimonadota bacterium]
MNITKKIGLFLASIAPGLFLIGYNIGTGSITTMASSGAAYGMKLIWPLLLSCLFTYFLIMIFGRYTSITGTTILSSYRKHFGNGITIFVLISLLMSEWISCMGVMGVVTQVIQEWSKPLTPSGRGFSPIISAVVFGALLYYFFWNGKHKIFEKILAVFVGIMGICFILTMFMVIPDPAEILEGLIPGIPDDPDAFLIMAGMVGTTMGAILYVVRSILVQEKGWNVADLKSERRDAIISVSMMFILSVAVMAAAAGTLHPLGLKVDNAIDMVRLMEPLAGRLAISVFVTGIVAAGLSSLFPIILLAPWLFADYNNRPRNMRSASTRLLVLFGVMLGLVVPVFGGRPVLVMIISQALCTIVSPVVLILMFYLYNRKNVLGKYTAGWQLNLIFVVVLIFTIAMAVAGIIGIVRQFS